MIAEVLKTITAAAIICTLLELVIPDGAMKKAVKTTVGLVFLLFIAEPIVQLLQ